MFLFMSKQIQYLSALHINKTYEGHYFVKLFKQFFFLNNWPELNGNCAWRERMEFPEL